MGTPRENTGHEEEGGRSLRGARLCVCLEWLVRNVDSDPQGCGVHREVEEAFTIQLIHHLSREAFLSNPHPYLQQFWFSGYRFLLACGTLYISLTLVTTVTSSYSCMYSLVTFSPLALHFVQSCAPVPNTAPGTPMLAQDAILPSLGVRIVASRHHFPEFAVPCRPQGRRCIHVFTCPFSPH